MNMVNIEDVKFNFRIYLTKFNGIQSFGVSYLKNQGTYHFIVNVEKKWYKETQKEIPTSFEGVPIELKRVDKARFLNIF